MGLEPLHQLEADKEQPLMEPLTWSMCPGCVALEEARDPALPGDLKNAVTAGGTPVREAGVSGEGPDVPGGLGGGQSAQAEGLCGASLRTLRQRCD